MGKVIKGILGVGYTALIAWVLTSWVFQWISKTVAELNSWFAVLLVLVIGLAVLFLFAKLMKWILKMPLKWFFSEMPDVIRWVPAIIFVVAGYLCIKDFWVLDKVHSHPNGLWTWLLAIIYTIKLVCFWGNFARKALK